MQIEVEAIDEHDAIEQAQGGNGQWVDNSLEFVDSLDSDTWIVELIEEGDDLSSLELANREEYTLNKIKELRTILDGKAKSDLRLKELTESALVELNAELEIIKNEVWASIGSEADESDKDV
tara:strand:- start:1152 stop:1517 length:366 start_codon:yes stop_codon:yes gene_type:complete